MSFDHRHYVPCLRWKQGEYQAVLRLSGATKKMFTPLIEVPEIGWDFENEVESKTIDEHLAPFARRVVEKWGRRPCFIDLPFIRPNELMATNLHPVHFVFDELRVRKCPAIPVTGLDRDNAYQREIRDVVTRNKYGLCLRIKIEQAAKGTLKDNLASALSRLKVKPENCDLIFDLGAPNFVPLEGFSTVIQQIVSKLPYLNNWRTFTVLGAAFPETMASIRQGLQIVPRYEWQLYKKIIASFRKSKMRLPSFGDCAICHPKVLFVDMRIAKPSATIRYTINNNWYIAKGQNVRDYGFRQYRELSRQIQNSRHWCGRSFSWGDEYIQECANGRGSTGNLTTWRKVGTNHHIVKVIRGIASFYASSSSR